MRRKLVAALRLTLPEWRLLARAWWVLLVVDRALRRQPLPQVQERFRAETLHSWRSSLAAMERMAHLVAIAARHHLRPMTCLQQAVTLQHLLQRQGVEADLWIGVQREGRDLRAHAWLHHQGRMVGEAQDVARLYLPLGSSTGSPSTGQGGSSIGR